MSSQLNNSILRLLECPVCMNYMSKRILCCVRGHSICSSCGRQLHACPSCKRPISLTHRNYSLESICELLEYPCSYAEAGCEEFTRLDGINDHRSTCSYRPYRCLLGGSVTQCLWQGTRFELTAHALIHHNDNISFVHSNRYKYNANSPLHEVNMVDAFEEIFLIHRKLVKDSAGNLTMYWAVQYVGKSEDIIQFYYKLHINCEEYQHRNITFTEYCCDDLGSIDKIIAEDFCVAVPMQQFDTYQDKNKEVCYEIFIHKM